MGFLKKGKKSSLKKMSSKSPIKRFLKKHNLEVSMNPTHTQYKSKDSYYRTKDLNDKGLIKLGVSNGYSDLELYHITSSANLEKIQQSGGLIGNSNPNGWHGLSEKGYLYATTSKSKETWDKIKEYQLLDKEHLSDVVNGIPTSKKYVVLKLNGSTLKKMGVRVSEDLNQSRENEDLCFKINLKNKMIPIKDVQIVGQFNTDYNISKERNILHEKRFIQQLQEQLTFQKMCA